MKIKKLLTVLLASSILIACKSSIDKQSKESDNKDTLLLASLQIPKVYEEDIIEETINEEELITIVDKRNGARYSDAPKEYLYDTALVDSLQIIARTANKFIKWYINESCSVAQDKLFVFSDSLSYYILDTIYSEYYLNELVKTEVVSDSLIKSLRRKFEQIKVDLENEKLGPEPDGLIDYDVDIIFNSQDLPAPFEVQEMKLKSFILRKRAKITVEFSATSASLIYENGDWKIIHGGY